MLNNCTLMGRLTHTPKLKTTQNSNNFVKFSLAAARPGVTADGEKITDFIYCIAWNNTAEFICKHLKKGEPIIIDGRIETGQYEDKQGNKRKVYEVIVNNVNFYALKKGEPQNTESTYILEESDSDLPF